MPVRDEYVATYEFVNAHVCFNCALSILLKKKYCALSYGSFSKKEKRIASQGLLSTVYPHPFSGVDDRDPRFIWRACVGRVKRVADDDARTARST